MPVYTFFTLTRPDAYHAVLAPFNSVAVLDAHPLDYGENTSLIVRTDTRPAVPVPAVRLVVDFDDVFACGGDNAARVEHHAGNRVIVGIGVIN